MASGVVAALAVCVSLLVPVFAVATPATAADAPSFVISGDTSIGGFRPYKMNGRVTQAIAVFGKPTTFKVRQIGTNFVCVATWRELGLSMSFVPVRVQTCVPERTCFFEAIATGRTWRTAKGLKIGDPRGRLYQLYPNAREKVGGWRTLLLRPNFPGVTTKGWPALSAKLLHLRVAAFRVTPRVTLETCLRS